MSRIAAARLSSFVIALALSTGIVCSAATSATAARVGASATVSVTPTHVPGHLHHWTVDPIIE